MNNVRLHFKENGEKWLNELPSILSYCEEKWEMVIQKPYNLSINYVAPAIMKDNNEVVVKVCIPGLEFRDEVEALKLFENQKMNTLLDYDLNRGILILEKLIPGATLVEVGDERQETLIAANILKNLHIKAPRKSSLHTTKQREKNLEEIITQYPTGLGPISVEELHKALDIFTSMNKTAKHDWLLHGDFHHYNILSSDHYGWMSIDPKGLIGEREYDLIQYMLNNLPLENAYETIENRVNLFTEELSLKKDRLLLWGYCHSVLSTAWSVDKDGTYSKPFFKGISIFEDLYNEYFT